MDNLRVLISAPYLLSGFDRFRSIFEDAEIEVVLADVQERLSEAELLAYGGQFDGTICGDDRYTARVLQEFIPRLKVISKWGTGIDSIDLAEAERCGIQVCNTPDAFTDAVADSVLGYILAFARQGPWLDRMMKQGNWDKLQGRALNECSLGVVGVGRIGKTVLCRAKGFGMELLANDIVEIAPAFVQETSVQMLPLPEVLEKADFVSLNCDLNPTSFHLIGELELARMGPTAVLVNTARGSVVDESALIRALESESIAGAALDVFEDEPLPKDSPLLQMDNVLLAPHNANSSPAAWDRVHRNTISNLLKGLGRPVPVSFPPQSGA